MNPLRSIRWRLLIWHGLLLALVLAGLGFSVYRFEAARQEERVDNELERRVRLLSSSVRRAPAYADDDLDPFDERPQPNMKMLRLDREEQRLFDGNTGYYYAVWLHNGYDVVSSTAPPDIPVPTSSLSGSRVREGYRETFVSPNPQDVVLAGYRNPDGVDELQHLAWMLVGGGLSILAVSLLGGWWLVSKVLRPVHDISVAAQSIASGDLSRRINTTETDNELGELAAVLNSSFSRLEAAFARQARFTADAAHELRTPVSVILTHTQNALGSGEMAEEHREAFAAAERAAQRMRRLIESLLRLARLDAGSETMHEEVADLADIAGDSVELVRPLAAEHRMELLTEFSPAVVRADPDRIAQVVTNLLMNAIQHHGGNEPGRIHVRVFTEAGKAVLSILDDGPGISPEHLGQIFERFYRADHARSGSKGGRAGLGLAICKAIVDAHGGTIEARNESGSGAHFIVKLATA